MKISPRYRGIVARPPHHLITQDDRKDFHLEPPVKEKRSGHEVPVDIGLCAEETPLPHEDLWVPAVGWLDLCTALHFALRAHFVLLSQLLSQLLSRLLSVQASFCGPKHPLGNISSLLWTFVGEW
eukprot:Skav212478  [mRNA]  locus=scaffold385:406131:406742:- [translate_table: standard]